MIQIIKEMFLEKTNVITDIIVIHESGLILTACK